MSYAFKEILLWYRNRDRASQTRKKPRCKQVVSSSRRSGNNDEGVVILHDCARIISFRGKRDNCGLFINEDGTARTMDQQSAFRNSPFLPLLLFATSK